MSSRRLGLLFLGILLAGSLLAQKALLKKADRYYKLEQWSRAIPLYQDALKAKESSKTRRRLADCHIRLNQMKAALEVLGPLAEGEKVPALVMLPYAEALMATGDYAAARQWLERYADEKPEDQRAAQLLASIEVAKNIKPYFQTRHVPSPLSINSDADDNGPFFWENQLFFASDRAQSGNLFEEHSGSTGRDFLRIYRAEQIYRDAFEAAQLLGGDINNTNRNSGPATMSVANGQIVFTRNSDVPDRRGTYTLQLYEGRYVEGKVSRVERLPFCDVNGNYMHPALSADGQRLYFASDRGRGEGGTDLFCAERLSNGTWGRPVNLGPKVNTAANEGFPFVAADGRLFFCSKGHPGFGGYDVFVTQQGNTGEWSKPLNVGSPVNSPADDVGICLHDDSLYFVSSREGGDDDIFVMPLPEGHAEGRR